MSKKAREKKQRVYVDFMDLENSYDRLLWEAGTKNVISGWQGIKWY